jgi:hypothetical protein
MSLWKKFLGQSALPPSMRHDRASKAASNVTGLMSVDDLIEEGRHLRRPCVFLKSAPNGEVAAVWQHIFPRKTGEADFEPWLTVDARFVPGFDTTKIRFLSVSSSSDCETGRVEVVPSLPPGLPLYAYPTEVLPPIDAIFALGSERVEAWLRANGWQRGDRYNGNFGDRAIVEAYDRVWAQGDPVFGRHENLYAALGGWPFANAEDDWPELLHARLLAVTVKDCEPWVEAWEIPGGGFRVVQRIT